MAILTPEQLAEVRREFAGAVPITCNKPQINAALQAIEDWFEANRASLGTAIDTATVPLGKTFTNPEKKQAVKFWLRQKFGRE